MNFSLFFSLIKKTTKRKKNNKNKKRTYLPT